MIVKPLPEPNLIPNDSDNINDEDNIEQYFDGKLKSTLIIQQKNLVSIYMS